MHTMKTLVNNVLLQWRTAVLFFAYVFYIASFLQHIHTLVNLTMVFVMFVGHCHSTKVSYLPFLLKRQNERPSFSLLNSTREYFCLVLLVLRLW